MAEFDQIELAAEGLDREAQLNCYGYGNIVIHSISYTLLVGSMLLVCTGNCPCVTSSFVIISLSVRPKFCNCIV